MCIYTGEEMEAEMTSGAGMIMPAGDHVVENVGEDDVEVLCIGMCCCCRWCSLINFVAFGGAVH